MNKASVHDDGILHARTLRDIPALEALLKSSCARAGASDEVLSDLRLATEEVFTNIFCHGYCRPEGPVTVTVAFTPEAVTVTLVDSAPDFDLASLGAPDINAPWQVRPIGGLGWHLVHQVMDEARREPGRHGGNVYTLRKKIPASPTRDL